VTAAAAAWGPALALALALPALACPPEPVDGRVLAGEGVTVAWRVEGGAAIPLAQPFALSVRLCPADAELLAVDATMPSHRHGMNYRPSLKPLGGGRWRVEGLLWHMRGAWELRLDLRHGGRSVVLRQGVELP
jgi:hypothetical protein